MESQNGMIFEISLNKKK